jgi:hypothetical protein
MRGLQVLVIVMGVMIVAGVLVVGVTISRRVAGLGVEAAARTLDAPPGTRIVGLAPVADRLALLLQGGGPDRVVVFDPRTGRTATLLSLPQ